MTPGQIKGVIAIALLLGAFLAGWTARGWKEDAARLEDERTAQETYRKTVEGWAAAVQKITGDRDRERQQAAADRREFTRSMANETRPLLECPPPAAAGAPPAGDGRLSGAFVGLWNKSLAIGLPESIRPRRSDGASRAPGPADPADVLANLADNSETCNDLRGKLLAWQAWARSIGAAK